MKALMVITMLGLVACGKSGSSSSSGTTLPPQAPGTTATVTLNASRTGSGGTDSPGSVTLSQQGTVTVPVAAGFTVVADVSETFHVSVTLGAVTCDFIHTAGSNVMGNGAGCTTAQSTVVVAAGQMLILDVSNNGQANTASVSLPLTVQY